MLNVMKTTYCRQLKKKKKYISYTTYSRHFEIFRFCLVDAVYIVEASPMGRDD